MNEAMQKLSKLIAPVAGTLAKMMGGPLAGTAVTALANAFGLSPDSTSADDITKIVQNGGMTPDIIAQVRAADQKHAEIMQAQGIDLAKLNAAHQEALAATDASDRDSARKREISVRGWTTPALAWLVVAASVGLGSAIIFGAVTKDPTQGTLIGTVIGYVFSEAKQVLAYYFGSSASNDRSTELLAQSSPVPTEGAAK